MEKKVCPFISTGNSIIRCHPNCKCINDDGTCKIIQFFSNIEKLTIDKASH